MGKEFKMKDVDEALEIVSKWLPKEAIERIGISAMEKFIDIAIKKIFGEDLLPESIPGCTCDSRSIKGVEEHIMQGSIDRIFPHETGLNIGRAFGFENNIHPLIDISDRIRAGTLANQLPFLKVGQFVSIENVQTRVIDGCPDHFIFEIAHITDNKVIFVAQQILNHKRIDPDGVSDFSNTTLAKWLNSDFLEKFPKEIVNRMCKTHDGLIITLPTRTEIFGQNDDYKEDYNWEDIKDIQFKFFEKIRNRIKTNFSDDDTWWWWTRSPWADGAPDFCRVDSGGGAGGHNAADGGGGVSPCFALS